MTNVQRLAVPRPNNEPIALPTAPASREQEEEQELSLLGDDDRWADQPCTD